MRVESRCRGFDRAIGHARGEDATRLARFTRGGRSVSEFVILAAILHYIITSISRNNCTPLEVLVFALLSFPLFLQKLRDGTTLGHVVQIVRYAELQTGQNVSLRFNDAKFNVIRVPASVASGSLFRSDGL